MANTPVEQGALPRMINNSKIFCAVFCAVLALSSCVANDPQQTSLAINSPLAGLDVSSTDISISDLPMEGPVPQSPPGILSLTSDANSGQPAIAAALEPGQLQAMLPPETTKSDVLAEISKPAQPVIASGNDRDCLMRTMYFESNRSSPDGLLAVGTVVMHRLENGGWGKSVCSVVQSRNQFAPGLMTRRMQGDLSDLTALADQILAGKRHPKLAKNVMFFHVAGMKFSYKNMRYVHVAGGNTFYYKAQRKRRA